MGLPREIYVENESAAVSLPNAPSAVRRPRASRARRRLIRSLRVAAPFLGVIVLSLFAAGLVRTLEHATHPEHAPTTESIAGELQEAPSPWPADEAVAEPARELLSGVFTEAGSPAATQQLLDLALAPALADDLE